MPQTVLVSLIVLSKILLGWRLFLYKNELSGELETYSKWMPFSRLTCLNGWFRSNMFCKQHSICIRHHIYQHNQCKAGPTVLKPLLIGISKWDFISSVNSLRIFVNEKIHQCFGNVTVIMKKHILRINLLQWEIKQVCSTSLVYELDVNESQRSS